jgi:1-acyl-sn-glycerol-3-phosphate acyltransferase
MELDKISIFEDNIYSTKENSRIVLDKLFLNTRLYFALKYIQLVFRNRKLAGKGLYNRKKWILSSNDVFRLIEKCGGKFQIEGLENIKNSKEPVVFISNHMSAMESMIFPALIAPHKKVTFVVKEDLTTHVLFGPVMRARNPVTVGRSNSREDLMSVLKQGKELLESGTSIVLFPQGSRKDIFNPKEFNSLGVKLAKSANVKIVPIAIKTDFWGNGKIIKDFGPIRRKRKIYICVGKPIEISGNGKSENDQAIEFIGSKLKTWK